MGMTLEQYKQQFQEIEALGSPDPGPDNNNDDVPERLKDAIGFDIVDDDE